MTSPALRVIVIGAGAAGTMAAIFAAGAGAETILLERTSEGGKKILISGGGRCNILPAALDESRFVTDSSPNSLKKILRSWPLEKQIEFFESEAGVRLKEEKETGKLFPVSDKARDIRDRLLTLARRKGVKVAVGHRVVDLARGDDGWRVMFAGEEPMRADAVIVATGGLSVPQTGSDGDGLAIADRLGHTVHPTYAALTPILSSDAIFTALAGVSLTVTIKAEDGARCAEAMGGFLFTHQGYSGPAVLDVSHVIARAQDPATARFTVNWASLGPDDWHTALTAAGATKVVTIVREKLPARLADALVARAGIDMACVAGNLRREARARLVDSLTRCELPFTRDAGYQKAEVTGGGVSLAEIDPRTMESRRHQGLFLCGEMLDAFGPIGGYNFYWAWVTGRAAGLGAAAAKTP